MHYVTRIISGGQDGADHGGLLAGEALGIQTGGTMPKGFLTESGPKPEYARRFGMKEHTSREYPPRTKLNVLDADGTVLFGRLEGGTKLTQTIAERYNLPWFHVSSPAQLKEFQAWLMDRLIITLNVAGNRESKNIGISERTKVFLMEALGGKN